MTHSVDRKHFDTTKANGLMLEQYVADELRSRMHDVHPSTRFENVVQDIDLYVDGKPCSVKSHKHSPNYDAAIFLEAQVQFADNSWHDSWFINGKAEYYYTVIHRGTMDTVRIYQISKRELVKFLEQNPDKFTTKTLSAKVRAAQVAGGHKHVNARNHVVPVKTLVDARVAHELT